MAEVRKTDVVIPRHGRCGNH